MTYRPTGVYVRPYTEADIVLQKSGDKFFVRSCTDSTYKPNQYIGDECLIMFQMTGMSVKIVDWQGKILELINY